MTLRVLSLGAGVQSTTVLLLCLDGTLPPVDAAIFADTGWEPRAVYEHLERLRERCSAAGLPLHTVKGGDVREIRPFGEGGALDVPFHVKFADGGGGISRRQCTSKLKIAPVRRKVRELMTAAGEKNVEQVFGISYDELGRMRDSDVLYIKHAYPLVDMAWTRTRCKEYLAEAWTASVVPRSACIGCPYHKNAEWRDMKINQPAEWAEAVAWERDLQAAGVGIKGKPDAIPFLHYSRVPLDEVDLSTPEDRGQLSFDDECEGMCGV